MHEGVQGVMARDDAYVIRLIVLNNAFCIDLLSTSWTVLSNSVSGSSSFDFSSDATAVTSLASA